MKPAKSRKSARKWRIDTKTVMGFFIIFIMTASTAGFYLGSSGESRVRDSGHAFYRTQSGWKLNIEKRNYYFDSLPSEVSHINISGNAVDIVRQSPMLYITSNLSGEQAPETALARYRITEFLSSENIYVEQGSLGYNDSFPRVDCTNATVYVPVILLQVSNETKIEEDKGCIILDGRNEAELLRAADRFLFGLIGVMP